MKHMPPKKLKTVPHFKNDAEEGDFWAKHDSIDYVDWSKAVKNPAFPALKPSTQTVSLRLSVSLLNELKRQAHQQDVPYQSLMKIYLSERVRKASA